MTEPEILTLNERLKTPSAYVADLSAALVAAAAARIWANPGVDLTAVVWLAAAIGLSLISWQLLYLLEATLEESE
ncbi:MAG TPA: hypothetical protein VF718_11625 [Allosphingosinicella sp.]